jgi:hypothetical protein
MIGLTTSTYDKFIEITLAKPIQDPLDPDMREIDLTGFLPLIPSTANVKTDPVLARLNETFGSLALKTDEKGEFYTKALYAPYRITPRSDCMFIPREDTRTGLKTSAHIEFSLKPELLVHEVTVSIDNFVPDIDISEFAMLRIKAGYNKPTPVYKEMDCPIFSSAVEEPNPNGRTVFHCLAAGWMDAQFLSDQPVTITFNTDKPSIKQIIDGFAEALPFPIRNMVDETVLERTVIIRSGSKYYANNQLQALSWLQTFLDNLNTQGIVDVKNKLIMQTTNTACFIYQLGIMSPKDIQDIVELYQVNIVNFQPGLINVTAPWNVNVTPGSVVALSPHFYKGRIGGNPAITKQTLDTSNIYRVIMMEVKFSSVANENRMDLLLTRLDNKSDLGQTSTDENMSAFTIEVTKSIKQKEVKAPMPIVIGSPHEVAKVIETPIVEVRKMSEKLPDDFTKDAVGYLIKKNDALELIARNHWCTFDLDTREETNGFIIPPKMPTAVSSLKPGSSISRRHFWPLILLATVKIKDSGVKNPDGGDFNDFSKDPDNIRQGKWVYVPKLPDDLDTLITDEFLQVLHDCANYWFGKLKTEAAGRHLFNVFYVMSWINKNGREE